MSTLTIRKPRKENLRKNIKIMNKPYHLVSGTHPDQMIVVHPPKSMLPGPTADGQHPKDEHGRWVRLFTIEDSNGVKQFQRKRFLLLYHFPGEVAYFTDDKGGKWHIEAIPEVHAVKARGKARKTFRAKTSAGRKRKSIGKAKLAKKTKVKPKQVELPKINGVQVFEGNGEDPNKVTAPVSTVPVSDKEPDVITIPTAGSEQKPS
jgi:hypothetical protein